MQESALSALKSAEAKTALPLVLRVDGATKPFDINKISFGPKEPWGKHGNTWHIAARVNVKDGIRLRTPFLHTGGTTLMIL